MKTKGIVGIILMSFIAAFVTHVSIKHSRQIASMLLPASTVYEAKPTWYTSQTKFEELTWEMLLPAHEYELISRYQLGEAKTVSDFTSQILNSIESASDKEYQQAMISVNTVDTFAEQRVSISGFIVPIDFYPNKDLQNVFLVPYFGACLHFPPPPPNQMIFIQLAQGFGDFDIGQAYTVKGKLNVELFEDFIGTSAYSLEPSSIKTYSGEPDTFRTHAR